MLLLWKDVFTAGLSEGAPEDPHRRESSRVLGVWEQLLQSQVSEGASESPYGRETLQVLALRQEFQSVGEPEDTRESSHRREKRTAAVWKELHHLQRSAVTQEKLSSEVIIVKSIQVTFIYIALLTIQIVSKQLYNLKIGE